MRVLEPSPSRVHAGVRVLRPLRRLRAAASRASRRRSRSSSDVVAQALTRIGRVEPEEWLPAVVSEPWHYRRRARLGVKYVAGKDRVLVGFRERAGPYITDMQHCPVLLPPIDGLLGELAELIEAQQSRGAAAADRGRRGRRRRRAGAARSRGRRAPADVQAFREFGARHDIDLYWQRGGPGTVAPLDRARPLRYRLAELDLTLRVLADGLRAGQCRRSTRSSWRRRCASLPSSRRIACSISTAGSAISACRSRGAPRELLGVEGEAGLVARAVRNAAANGIGNARFVTADLMASGLELLPRAVGRRRARSAAHGRRGAGRRAAMRSKPRRIVYVSCHPATLARDAQVLVERHGFKLRAARVFDMFPHTHHIEALALFERE